MSSEETRRDVEAALAARRELGPEFEDHIAAGLADRVEELARQRSTDLAQYGQGESRLDKLEARAMHNRFVLGIISLGAGIPITAISASYAHLPGLAVAWLGIVGVNVANSLSGRRRRDTR